MSILNKTEVIKNAQVFVLTRILVRKPYTFRGYALAPNRRNLKSAAEEILKTEIALKKLSIHPVISIIGGHIDGNGYPIGHIKKANHIGNIPDIPI